jgi:hypothetical protein
MKDGERRVNISHLELMATDVTERLFWCKGVRAKVAWFYRPRTWFKARDVASGTAREEY